eukprot:tig00000796_g4239.t1
MGAASSTLIEEPNPAYAGYGRQQHSAVRAAQPPSQTGRAPLSTGPSAYGASECSRSGFGIAARLGMKVYDCVGADVGLTTTFPGHRGSRAGLAAEATAVDLGDAAAFKGFCSQTFVERTKRPAPSLLDQMALARIEEAERRREKAARRAMADARGNGLSPPGHTGPAPRILSLSAGGSPLLTTEPFAFERSRAEPGGRAADSSPAAELREWVQRALDAEQQAREQKRVLDQLVEDFRLGNIGSAPRHDSFVEEKRRELAAREVRAEEAEAAARERVRALDAREAAVRAAEERIRADERALGEMMDELLEKKRALDRERAEAAAGGAGHGRDRTDEEREAALRRRERAVTDRETLLAQQQAALEEREAAVAEKEAAQEAAGADANAEAEAEAARREAGRREAEELARSVLRVVDAIHGRQLPGLPDEDEEEEDEEEGEQGEDEEAEAAPEAVEPRGRRRWSSAERLLRSERRWVREQLAAVTRVLQKFLAEGEALRRSAEAAEEGKSHAILSVERMLQQLTRVAADASAAHVEAERLREVVGTLTARLTSAQTELATLRPRAAGRTTGTQCASGSQLPAIPETSGRAAREQEEEQQQQQQQAEALTARAGELEALVTRYEGELKETAGAVLELHAALEQREAELAERRREVELREVDVMEARYVAQCREREAGEAERAAALARRDNQLLLQKINAMHSRLTDLTARYARARSKCSCRAFAGQGALPKGDLQHEAPSRRCL